MNNFVQTIKEKISNNEPLFYNTSGNKEAFKLGVKHLSSSLFLGFAHTHQGVLYIDKDLTLVDFETQSFTLILKGSKLTITPLKEK
jgi:hypothetical protein